MRFFPIFLFVLIIFYCILLILLRQSALYRADQHSYILYPDRDLPGFLQKNRLNPELVKTSALLTELVEKGDTTLILRDENGTCHFPGSYRNAKDVKHALAGLRERDEYADLVDAEYDTILDLFERDRHTIEGLGRAAPSTQRLHRLMQTRPLLSIPVAARELALSVPTITASMQHL